MALQSSILTQSAISRLYEDWIVFCLWVVTSGDVSQQPGNGLFPLSYIYFILFFFLPLFACTGSPQRISD